MTKTRARAGMTDESEEITARDQWELVKKAAMSTGDKAAYVAEGVFESAAVGQDHNSKSLKPL